MLSIRVDLAVLSLTFVGPISATVHLFMHILRQGDNPSARSDVALLNVCAGYFAQLEFATDAEISFPFVSQVASLARENLRWKQSVHGQPRSGLSVQPHDNSDGWQSRREGEDATTARTDETIVLDGEHHTVSVASMLRPLPTVRLCLGRLR